MCCRLSIQPVDKDLAYHILKVGLFTPTYYPPNDPEHAVNWTRTIMEDNGTQGIVTVTISGEALDLNLSPAISVYSQHLGRRIQAGVYFEIAAKYAEHCHGEIRQLSTVVGCKDGDAPQALLVAHYPDIPMNFTRICRGFQAVLLADGGSGEEDRD